MRLKEGFNFQHFPADSFQAGRPGSSSKSSLHSDHGVGGHEEQRRQYQNVYVHTEGMLGKIAKTQDVVRRNKNPANHRLLSKLQISLRQPLTPSSSSSSFSLRPRPLHPLLARQALLPNASLTFRLNHPRLLSSLPLPSKSALALVTGAEKDISTYSLLCLFTCFALLFGLSDDHRLVAITSIHRHIPCSFALALLVLLVLLILLVSSI